MGLDKMSGFWMAFENQTFQSFETRSSKCPDFEWIRILNIQFSDPHCTLNCPLFRCVGVRISDPTVPQSSKKWFPFPFQLSNVVVKNANVSKSILQRGRLERRTTFLPLDKMQGYVVPVHTLQVTICFRMPSSYIMYTILGHWKGLRFGFWMRACVHGV